MYGTVSHLDYERGYAAVRNTPQQAAFVAGVAKECFGPDILGSCRRTGHDGRRLFRLSPEI